MLQPSQRLTCHYQQPARIPVIILTNLGIEESPKVLKDLSVHSYIVKAELTPSQVVTKVKEALGL